MFANLQSSVPKNHYHLAMHIFGLLTTANSMDELDDMVQSAAVVLSSVSSGDNVEKHFNNLQSWLKKIGFQQDETSKSQLGDEDLTIIHIKKIQEGNIIAMDETAVWFDMVGATTVDIRGARSVSLKTTGHEKCHLTVVLAAKADGTKLKPYVVFKGSIREVKAMQNVSGVVAASSKNGWMNEALTADWLQKVVGKLNFAPRLLVWDSYRCHISTATKAELKRGYNMSTAVIPGGCTKYIQAPDVVWNQPFKASLRDSYNKWMAGDTDKEYTKGGNVRAPACRLLVSWVLQAWDKLDAEMVKNSFKVCGLTVAADGSEDHLIHCFKEGEPCASGRKLLAEARQSGMADVGEGADEENDEEEFYNELVVEDDSDEGDTDE
ncbi:uncharacterized protein V6R79_020854 [Siganus canaliculatus]